jgi:CO/xanthine dehydrogenase Mo-binding subunit
MTPGDRIRVVLADDHSVIRAGLRAVAHGDVYVQSSAARILAKNLTKKDPAALERERFEKLTQRERDVLKLVAHGFRHRRSVRSCSSVPRRWTATSSASRKNSDCRIARRTCGSRSNSG